MRKALVVSAVKSGSQGENLGIKEGDIITSYNETAIFSNNELSTAVWKAKNKNLENIQIVLTRKGEEINLIASLEPLGVDCVENNVNENTPSGNLRKRVQYDSDYGVARGVCSLVAFFGWVLVLVGGSVTIMAIVNGTNARYGGFSLLAILPGLGTVVSGFLMIMGAQVTRATVDNADHTREILQAISKQ